MKKPNLNPPRSTKTFKALDAAYELISALVPVVKAVGAQDRSLKSQLQKAASSIPLNLSEGWGLQDGSKRQRYLTALGSAREVGAIIETARRWRYISTARASEVSQLLDQVIAMTYRLAHPR